MQTIELTDIEKDFAQYVGYEVNLKDGGTGINLGLYFPETWAADGIIKPNGVNVFFPEQNKIYVQNFNQVELIFPNGINRMNQSEALFGFLAFLTTRSKAITIGAEHSTPAALDLLHQFMKVNNLPRCREGWEEFLIPMPEQLTQEPYEAGAGISTKHTSQCLRKAKDDEPIFVLRSKDPTAPRIVRAWASVNEEIQPEVKVKGARDLAVEMESWFRENCI